jgi:hypothetical protein
VAGSAINSGASSAASSAETEIERWGGHTDFSHTNQSIISTCLCLVV